MNNDTEDGGGIASIVLFVVGVALLALGIGNLTDVVGYQPPAVVHFVVAAVMFAIAITWLWDG